MKNIAFLLLVFVSVVSTPVTYNFTDAQISVETVSSGTIYFTGPGDTCKKIVLGADQIYHLSTQSQYESWPRGSLGTSTTTQSGVNNTDFGVDKTGKNVVFTFHQYIGSYMCASIKIFSLNSDYTFNNQRSYSQYTDEQFDYIFVNETTIYTYQKGTTPSTSSYLQTWTLSTGNDINEAVLNYTYTRFTINPNFTQAVIWTAQTQIQFISLPSLSIIGSFTPTVTPSSGSTSKITFSADSSLALIETDQANPLVVLHMSNYSELTSFSITHTITEAHFLDASNSIVVVLCPDATIFVDLSNNNTQYAITAILETTYATDQQNYLFSCTSNVVKQTYLNFTRIASATIPVPTPTPTPSPAPSPTPQPTPPPTPAPTQNQTSTNSSTPPAAQSINESEFYTTYEMNLLTTEVLNTINDSLTITTSVTNIVSTFATSMPITVYFLGFVNYFTLSSLYVLLNFPLPENIYKYLSLIYDQINSNFLAVIGENIAIPPLSDEKVDRKKILFFGVSSDVASSDVIAFIFLAGNIILVSLLHCLCSNLNRHSAIRNVIGKGRWGMIYGQFINIMTQLILPWIFLMFSTSRNLYTKGNLAVYLFLFFIGMLFPIYYLFELLRERSHCLIEKEISEKKKKQNSQSIKRVIHIRKNLMSFQLKDKYKKTVNKEKKLRFQDEETQKKQPNFTTPKKQSSKNQKTFKILKIQIDREVNIKPHAQIEKSHKKRLLTFEIAEQWHICQANFIYPLLVILPDPAYFMVAIAIFSGLGVFICFKKKKMRVNSFILSLYPFAFHVCFMILYWCSSMEVLIRAEVCCLGLYLMGSVHHCLTFLYEILTFLKFIFKNLCRQTKINPVQPADPSPNAKSPPNLVSTSSPLPVQPKPRQKSKTQGGSSNPARPAETTQTPRKIKKNIPPPNSLRVNYMFRKLQGQ